MDSPAVPDTATPAPTRGPAPDPTPELPAISNYWPDAPHRAGPPADHYELDGAAPTRTEPIRTDTARTDTARTDTARSEPARQASDDRDPSDAVANNRPTVELTPGRPTLELTVIGSPSHKPWPFGRTVTALVAGIVAVGGIGYVALRPSASSRPAPVFSDPIAVAPATPPVSIGTSPPAGPAPVIPAAATFELADGTTALDVSIGDTGSGWFRVSAPQGSAVAPRPVVEGGAVRVFVDKVPGRTGPARVDVLLSPAVTWSVLMRGGVRDAVIDLTGGRVTRVDLLGGAASVDLALPRQDPAVPISMSGGIRDWRISTGAKVPVRAVLQRGAGAVVLYGVRDQGVDKGARFTVAGGDGGIDLIADEGVGTLTVTAGRDEGTIGG